MNEVEFGKEIAACVKDYVALATADLVKQIAGLEARIAAIPSGKDGKDGRDGADGKDGRDGVDGKNGDAGERGKDGTNVSLEDVRPLVAEAVKAIPVPRDGINGKDGASVTAEDVLPLLEAKCASWMLELERRHNDQFQRFMDALPRPKDGKDGTDGFGFEDLGMSFDGKRRLGIKFQQGETVKEFEFVLPIVIDCGVFKEGQTYEKGDGVTWAGNYWIAQKDTDAKPLDGSQDWRLAVRRGRDGKQGPPGR